MMFCKEVPFGKWPAKTLNLSRLSSSGSTSENKYNPLSQINLKYLQTKLLNCEEIWLNGRISLIFNNLRLFTTLNKY